MKSTGQAQTIFLSLGSNLGDRTGQLNRALSLVSERIGIIKNRSGIYESAAWGFLSKNMFYNICAEAETVLSPMEVMNHILEIEKIMGRKRSGTVYADRPIDIDLLFYGNHVLNKPDLTIPHPGIPERKFVLIPLQEIAPDLMHPVLHLSIADLTSACKDSSSLKPVSD